MRKKAEAQYGEEIPSTKNSKDTGRPKGQPREEKAGIRRVETAQMTDKIAGVVSSHLSTLLNAIYHIPQRDKRS